MATPQNWWEQDRPVATQSEEWWAKDKPASTGGEWWAQDKPVSGPTQFIDARTKKEETPEDQSVFRQVADVPLQLQKGVVTGVRLIADAFGANSKVSQNLRDVEGHLASLMSAQSKQDSREIARIMKDAEDKGILEQVQAGVKALAVAPVDTIVNALGTSAPAIVAGLTATVAGAPTAAVLGTTATVGSVMGAGTVKSAIYETVKEELEKAGIKNAEARAVKAQEYFGDNMGSIVTGAGLGTLEAITGAQPAIARLIANRLARSGAADIAENVAEQAAKGYFGTAAKTAAKEAAPEFLQGAQEQLARNLALQEEGFDVPTMRGVVAQGTLEAGAGAGLGATTGVAEVMADRRAAGREQRAVDEAQTAIDAEIKARVSELEALPTRTPEQEKELVNLRGEVETEAVDVAEPTEAVVAGAEPSTGVPAGGIEAAPGGIETPLASGLDVAEQLSGAPITGAAVQSTPLTPPLPTYEQAQAVLDTLDNKEQLQIEEAPDGGFVVAQRAPVVEPAVVAPPAVDMEMGAAAPSPAVEPTVEITEPSAAPAIAEAVEAQPATAPAEVVETTPEEVITEEPSVAETTEAIEAEAQRQEEAAAPTVEDKVAAVEAQVVRQRAPGGGRKKSDAAKTPEERKAEIAAINADRRDIEGRAAAVGKLSTGLAPEQFKKRGVSAEEAQAAYETAEAERKQTLWDNKLFLYIASVDPLRRGTKAGEVARAAVAKFTPQEQAYFKQAYDKFKAEERGMPLKSTNIYTSDEADPKFGSATTAQQALRRVMNTGKPFEKLLAQRLLNAVKGVQFVVIRPDTTLPPEISRAFKDDTQGVYYEARKTIYVRDESFGDVNGVNNTIVLHEALHAATTLRLDYALALAERGELDTAPALQAFAQMMLKTMERAELVYRVAKAEGRSTPYLDGLHEIGAFTDVREFVSYGLTDNMMQQFLATQVPGMKMSMFSRFVEAIRKLFGFDANSQSAFQDLVVTTDALLSERLPRDASIIVTTPDTLTAIKKSGKEAKKQEDKIRQPISHPEETFSTIGQLLKTRSWDEFKDVVSDIYNGTASQFRRPLLGALTTRQIVDLQSAQEIKGGDGKPVLEELLRTAEDMNGAKAAMLDETATMAKEWHTWQRANPGKSRTLNRLIHLSTINQIDPSVSKTSKTLTDMYESLGDDGKALYNKIRDFYKARFLRYKDFMVNRIGDMNVDERTRELLLAKLEKDFADMPQPYFPLVREGKYWVRIGNPRSKNMEYYMFEDPRERNFFVRQRAKELGLTAEELRNDPSQFGMGDNYLDAVDEGMRSSKMLKDVLDLVDGASFDAKTDAEKFQQQQDLKDAIQQLYFSTLPEQNFRKHFLHRKGTAGYRSDALRNFAKSSFHTSVQIAKIEYGQKLRNTLTRAWDSTEGNPKRNEVFKPIIDEMRDRVDNILAPERTDEMATKLANTFGTASFIYYMSAPASALTNLTGLAVFGVPVLNGEFGPKANITLAKNMNIFRAVGTTDKDGKFTFPTLLSRLEGRRRDAYMEALRRGKIDTTLTYDTLQLSRTPSEQYSGASIKAADVAGYLFHHSEKLNREVMFMTAYDLAYERSKKAGRDDKTANEEALNDAGRLVDEAMFDYSEFNKPRFFRGNFKRVLLQFKSFAQQTTYYLVRNFKAMLPYFNKEDKAAAATRFFGTLGMTALFAGSLGLPLVSVLMFAMSFLSEDEEDPEKRNPKLRFRKFLREEFGNDWGLALERGPVSWATDVDFHSRVKLDQLWFRELKTNKSEPEVLTEFIMNMMGPTVGLFTNAAEGLRRINQGEVYRGMEMLLPAGIRGFAAAYRESEEGVKTLKGDQVVKKEDLTATNIATTAIGFKPAKVAATLEDAAQAKSELQKIQQSRDEVYRLFKRLLVDESQSARDAALRALREYNKKNKLYPIDDPDTIFTALESEAESRAMAIRGVRVAEKLRPAVERLMPKSLYEKE